MNEVLGRNRCHSNVRGAEQDTRATLELLPNITRKRNLGFLSDDSGLRPGGDINLIRKCVATRLVLDYIRLTSDVEIVLSRYPVP